MQKLTLNGTDRQAEEVKSLHHKEFRRPILSILSDLRKPIPPRFIKHKTIKGQKIAYVPWFTLTRLLDYFCPAWDWEISTNFDGNQVCVMGKLTLKAAEMSEGKH